MDKKDRLFDFFLNTLETNTDLVQKQSQNISAKNDILM